jgi:hypothetical protein
MRTHKRSKHTDPHIAVPKRFNTSHTKSEVQLAGKYSCDLHYTLLPQRRLYMTVN